MNILIVTHSIGRSPAGIVAEQLAEGLWEAGASLMIVCARNHSQLNEGVHCLEFPAEEKVTQLKKALYILLNRDPAWIRWIRTVEKKSIREIQQFNPDFVLGLAAGQSDQVPALSAHLAKRIGKPLHLHAVDAIPSPEVWGVNPYLRKAILKSVKPHFRAAHSVSLTNPVMLEYQLQLMGIPDHERAFVVYNPFKGKFIEKEQENGSSQQYALYLGSLNKMRHARALVSAMEELNKSHPGFRLRFVGTDRGEIASYYPDGEIPEYIEVIGWTENPEPHIRNADILVDIDIDRPGDVFMSSKLVRYLGTDIPILSITEGNSPARRLLEARTGDAVVVSHRENEIAEGVEKILNGDVQPDSRARLSLLREFDLKRNLEKIVHVYR